jgi:hypothetical protein
MLLYNNLNTPLDIFDIIVYLTDLGYVELVPQQIFPQEKDTNTLFLIDYENGMSEIISDEKACIQFLSDQSLIMHLKDKANDYVRYLNVS